MATELSQADKEFLAKCEEKFKDRFTENEEDFMSVFKAEPSIPPIVENWWVSNNSGQNDRRNRRRYNTYERHGNGTNHHNRRDNDAGYSRGYSDYNNDNYRSNYNRRPY